MAHVYERVALIGLGLIASSMAHAIRKFDLAGSIAGYARSGETRETVRELGFCDEVFETAPEVVRGADLVVLCTPVGVMGDVVEEIGSCLVPGTTLSEVGSVKMAVIEAVVPRLPSGVHFVPTHPVAGTEMSGPRAGFAELFDGRWCLFTPLPGTSPEAIERLRSLWCKMGALVDEMDPERHDMVLAVTSHVPHLIAYTMVGVADDLRRVSNAEVVQYSAAGFRDFTRIAASDPTMWRDVFMNNRKATLEILGRFSEELSVLQRAIRGGDGELLHEHFSRTRSIRRGIIEAGQDTGLPDFGRSRGIED